MFNYKGDLTLIKGIGEKKAAKFKKLGLDTIEDLLWHVPIRYEDRRKIEKIANAKDGSHYSFEVVVRKKSIPPSYLRQAKKIAKVLVDDGSRQMELIFINNIYGAQGLEIGKRYFVHGHVKIERSKFAMFNPEILDALKHEGFGIKSFYPLCAQVTNSDLSKAISNCKEMLLSYQPNVNIRLPHHRDFDVGRALYALHFPQEIFEVEKYKGNLIYYELFQMQMAIAFIKHRIKSVQKHLRYRSVSIEEVQALFEWEFTDGQKEAIEDIFADMDSPDMMNRLIQGDVGSGKTAVSQCAAFKAVKSGYQVAIMSPTEILAKQHYESFSRVFEKHAKVVLLTSSSKKKSEIYTEIAEGKIDIVVGTHALISEQLQFSNPALVITDEQHRFGVQQRRTLSHKSQELDIIVMSATPIPRTLSLILYGDMSISEIHGFPKNRIPIETFYIQKKKYADMLAFIEKRIQEGEKAYFVAPTIEESQTLKLKSLETLYEELMPIYSKYGIAMLHSKLKPSEKEAVMGDFASGKIHVIVATTVIEVGIDVSDATVMVITHSERFGLSQLHQLRGRIGRGSRKSYCFLLADKLGEVSKKRIQTMLESNDGFYIAQKDLEIRGPGEFTGIRQHGCPEFKIADIMRDRGILEEVISDIAKMQEKFTFEEEDFSNYLQWLNERLTL